MRLEEVVGDVGGARLHGEAGTEVGGIAYHSERVSPSDLFCCIPGARSDGHDHAAQAVQAGASSLLVERHLPVDVPQVVVPDTRAAMALCASTFYGHPSRDMVVVGITGTNGKTTTAHLLGWVLGSVEGGGKVRVMGTLTGVRTTPEAPDLQAQLAAWRAEGVTHVAMEVSSHALELRRVDGMAFAVAVFTNLSRDHLDFHQSMESYFAAKARLFEPELSALGVVNLDSPHGRLLRDASAIPVVGYSMDMATDLEVGPKASSFGWRGQRVELGLGGRFNVSNALAAAEVAVALGADPEPVAAALATAPGVPGRFEVIDEGQDFSVVVDYAHTPDGLEQVLAAVGEATAPGGSVVVVFGCGGERDATKRPLMGEVAARMADRVVLTADNSRSESTRAIIEAVEQGFDSVVAQEERGRRARELVVEPDRRAAVAEALRGARPGDAVLLAGKGHEDTLTIGDEVVAFDDRAVAREELRRLLGDGGAS